MMEKLKLYIGKSIGELNEKSSYNFDSGRSTKIHINHSEKTFQAAEEARLKGDEERAYVLYMRYIDIYQKVKASKEFKKDASHFSLLLGTTKVMDAVSKAESLSKSLRERYEATKSNPEKSDGEKTKPALTNGTGPKTNLPNGTKIGEQPKIDSTVVTKLELLPKDAKSISSQKLYELLFAVSRPDCKILLVDIRPENDFSTSQIRYPDSINIPGNYIKPGSTCGKIEAQMSDIDYLDLWKKRAEFDLMVLIDWNSKEKELENLASPLRSLHDALFKWDQEIFLKHCPVVLNGGYGDWLEYYPQFTTNPKVQKPSAKSENQSNLSSLTDSISFTDLLPTAAKREPNSENENESPNASLQNGESSNDVTMKYTETFEPEPQKSADATSSNATLSSLFELEQWAIPNGNQSNTSLEKAPRKLPPDPPRPQPKHNMPVVNRATKPGTKPVHEPDPVVKEPVVPPTGQSNGYVEQKISPSEDDTAVAEMMERLEAMKKKKEAEALKHKEIESKKRMIELQLEEQKMIAELEEEAKKRKAAERDLAEKMRGLRRPKPATQEDAAKPPEKSEDDTTQKSNAQNLPLKNNETDVNGENVGPSLNTDVVDGMDKKASTVEVSPGLGKAKKPVVKVPVKRELPEKPASNVPKRPDAEKPKMSNNHPETTATQEIPKNQEPKVKENIPVVEKKPTPAIPAKNIPKNDTAPSKPAPVKSVTPKPASNTPEKVESEVKPSINKPSSSMADKKQVPQEQVSYKKQPMAPNTVKKTSLKKPKENVIGKDPKTDTGYASTEQRTPRARAGSSNLQLPINWEKRLDASTGRYYYLDHNTKTTHWNLPKSVTPQRPPKTAQPKPSTGGSLRRSTSTPNIAQLIEEEEKATKKTPIVPSRDNKPTKPVPRLDSAEDYAKKLQELHPASGGRGPGLCGLQNLGNTCYMNSVLQCMFNTALLSKYFLSNDYKHDINTENFLGSGGQITDGFAMILKAVWSGQFKYLTPRVFRLLIAAYNQRFGSYSQQDSQELLLFLMDGLHEDLNLIRKREYIEEKENDNMDDFSAAEQAWSDHKRLNKSIIVELFQGQFKATMKCLYCGKQSRKFDVFMYLSLPLPSRSCSLNDCIRKFNEAEKLSGDNKWRCPKCKTERDAERRIEIWKLPPVLLIHFKRFSFSGRWGDKVQTSVNFPTSGLDLNNFVKGPKSKKTYNLYAVSHHHGATLDSGHYVASCKSPIDGNWYKYDDHEVSRTSTPSGSSAYILCYTSIAHKLDLVR